MVDQTMQQMYPVPADFLVQHVGARGGRRRKASDLGCRTSRRPPIPPGPPPPSPPCCSRCRPKETAQRRTGAWLVLARRLADRRQGPRFIVDEAPALAGPSRRPCPAVAARRRPAKLRPATTRPAGPYRRALRGAAGRGRGQTGTAPAVSGVWCGDLHAGRGAPRRGKPPPPAQAAPPLTRRTFAGGHRDPRDHRLKPARLKAGCDSAPKARCRRIRCAVVASVSASVVSGQSGT
jgi:hypothetical protein